MRNLLKKKVYSFIYICEKCSVQLRRTDESYLVIAEGVVRYCGKPGLIVMGLLGNGYNWKHIPELIKNHN